MEIRRDRYLERLIAHKGNGRVKIVTGIRRCGKSYLLFQFFKRHLIETGVKPNHIIEIQLEDRSNKELRNPDACLAFIKKQIKDQKPNPKKLEDTFTSSGTGKLSAVTIKQYLDYLCDAFMIEQAERYDIKGKRYISTPYKYYFTDTGLRNARLNFRQLEETHLMENVMYNELCLRGYSVDVGVVEINERQEDGKYVRKQIEVDFVCNKADERVYVQSAFSIPTTEKRQQEERPLVNVGDGFRKVVVTKDNVIRHNDENGILIMSLQEFLMDERALEK